MMKDCMSNHGGIIGVSDHGGLGGVVAGGGDGTLLDRRRVELVGEGLPKIPHHSEGQRLPPDEAVELVERVCVCRRKDTSCLGGCHDDGAAYPWHRPAQVPTASTHDCRTNQG